MPNRSPVEDAPMDVVDNDFMALDACKMKLPPEAYQQLNDHCCRMIVDHMVKMHYERVFRQIKHEAEKLGVHAHLGGIEGEGPHLGRNKGQGVGRRTDRHM